MLPEKRAFWIRGEDGQEYGPVDLAELREWVLENRAGLGSEVCLDEPGALWQPWQYYPELVALLAVVNVTGTKAAVAGTVIAPIWRRVVAWVIDVMLLSILFFPVKGVLDHFVSVDAILQAATSISALQDLPPEISHQVVAFEIIINASLVLYLTGFHAAHGKTPANALLHIRVVDQEGQKPALGKALIRALTLIISINLIFPLLYIFFNPQRRAIHDLFAGTYVVET